MKGIIFDLDGTLLDTMGDLAAAVTFSIRNNDYMELEESTIKTYVGNGARILMARSVPGGFDAPNFDKCMREYSEYYFNNCMSKTVPYDGVMQLLKELKNKGIKTAVLSNKPDRATKLLCGHYFGDLIDPAMGERAGVNKKPDPAGIYDILKIFGLSADEVVYAGDSEVDIMTAKNSGMKCISCCWGFKPKAFLIENNAQILIDKPLKILNYI